MGLPQENMKESQDSVYLLLLVLRGKEGKADGISSLSDFKTKMSQLGQISGQLSYLRHQPNFPSLYQLREWQKSHHET